MRDILFLSLYMKENFIYIKVWEKERKDDISHFQITYVISIFDTQLLIRPDKTHANQRHDRR